MNKHNILFLNFVLVFTLQEKTVAMQQEFPSRKYDYDRVSDELAKLSHKDQMLFRQHLNEINIDKIKEILAIKPELANIHIPGHMGNIFPLDIALDKKNIELFKILLDAGANPNSTNNDGNFDTTIIERAALEGNASMVELLLKADAQPKTFSGDSLIKTVRSLQQLSKKSYEKYQPVINFLIAKGAQ